MGFIIQCDNKGCHKSNEPLLNVETDEVICSECEKPINSITPFAKTNMKSLGQIYRGEPKKKQAFSVQCKSCQKHNTPKVEGNNKLVCPKCGVESHISGPMKQAILGRAGKI